MIAIDSRSSWPPSSATRGRLAACETAFLVGLVETTVVRGSATPGRLAVVFRQVPYLLSNGIAILFGGIYRFVLDERWTRGRTRVRSGSHLCLCSRPVRTGCPPVGTVGRHAAPTRRPSIDSVRSLSEYRPSVLRLAPPEPRRDRHGALGRTDQRTGLRVSGFCRARYAFDRSAQTVATEGTNE